jgi:hypothetical protein
MVYAHYFDFRFLHGIGGWLGRIGLNLM